MSESINGLEWENICEKDECSDYSPLTHTHEFKSKNEDKKRCGNCELDMRKDAQIFENKFGKNELIVGNAYKCKCGHIDMSEVVYRGLPFDISAIVKKRIE